MHARFSRNPRGGADALPGARPGGDRGGGGGAGGDAVMDMAYFTARDLV